MRQDGARTLSPETLLRFTIWDCLWLPFTSTARRKLVLVEGLKLEDK